MLCLFKHVGVEVTHWHCVWCLHVECYSTVEINAKGQVICEPSPLERWVCTLLRSRCFTDHLCGCSDIVLKSHKSAVSHKMTNYEVGLQACVRKFCDNPDAILNANICVPFDSELKATCCINCRVDVQSNTATGREGKTNEASLLFVIYVLKGLS